MQALSNYSNVGVPGRFIFRIDEWIQPAGCADINFEQKSNAYKNKINFMDLWVVGCGHLINKIFFLR